MEFRKNQLFLRIEDTYARLVITYNKLQPTLNLSWIKFQKAKTDTKQQLKLGDNWYQYVIS